MPEIPRLNGVIRALEQGKVAFVGFAPADVETASALAGANLDGVAFEMEHAPMSAPGLRDALQYMLDRRQILESGTLAPRCRSDAARSPRRGSTRPRVPAGR
jgi:4-hydroxy-2-oxoheptanedioate aldolase